MINTKLAFIEPKSTAKVSTIYSLIISIITSIILIISGILLINGFPQLKEIFPNNSLGIFGILIGVIMGIIVGLIINYAFTYLNALLYNYLIQHFKGIQFELTPHNEIKEIDIIPSLTMIMIIMAVWLIIEGILLFISFSVVLSLLSHASTIFRNINMTSLATGSLTVVTISVLFTWILFAILSLIVMFIFNFYSRRNPLKLDIIEDQGLEIKSIDILSYVMSAGFTIITLELIRTLISIMISGSMEVAILNIINTIALCLVFSTIAPFIYNFIASKVGGIRFDIVPSDNMVQEYSIDKK